jgi:molybdenum cofactor cytidylyltransferase
VENISASPFEFGVTILAAGRSQRMGRPKLLLPWNGTSVLGHLLKQWRTAGAAQIAVVCDPDATELQNELKRLEVSSTNWIFNSHPDRGMFSSVQCAARWNEWRPALTHFVVTLGDQPHLQQETLGELIAVAKRNPESVCQPLRNARRRHPVIFPKRNFFELRNSEAANLKEFLASAGIERAGFESTDVGLEFDMDTPADYERLREMFQQADRKTRSN